MRHTTFSVAVALSLTLLATVAAGQAPSSPPEADAGTPAADGGIAVADGGPRSAEAGVAGADAGTTTADAGATTADAGTEPPPDPFAGRPLEAGADWQTGIRGRIVDCKTGIPMVKAPVLVKGRTTRPARR